MANTLIALKLATHRIVLRYQMRFHERRCKLESNETDNSVATLRSQAIGGCSSTILILIFLCNNHPSVGYTWVPIHQSRKRHIADVKFSKTAVQTSFTRMSLGLSYDFQDDGSDATDANFMKDLSSRAEEIQVDLIRDRLERANTMDFLKRKPRKLPYEDARRWIQANLGANTKEEFYDLVENGNLRTPYIPKRPEEHYSGTREWISWEHFLTGIFDKEQPSAVRPSTGIFD
jgi:hypothetical protein